MCNCSFRPKRYEGRGFSLKKNFTLIELIVSIVVIGILAAIVMLNISDLRLQAEETAYAVNEREVQSAVDRYKLEYGEYPTTPQPTKGNPQIVELDKIVPEFIRKKPKGEFKVEVDEKGKTTLIREGGNEDGEVQEPPYVQIQSCEEAVGQGYICISNEEEFNNIRNNLSGKYILMNNIDLSGYSNWTPIGNSTAPFTGELNGNKFTINSLTFSDYSSVNVGVFGVVSYGLLQNINLMNTQMENSLLTTPTENYDPLSVGTLIGKVYGDGITNPAQNPLEVKNITLESSVGLNSFGNFRTSTYYGGMIGSIEFNSDITIQNVDNTYNYKSDKGEAGGLVGYIEYNNSSAQADLIIKNITISGTMHSLKDSAQWENCTYRCGYVSGLIHDVDMYNVLNGTFSVSDINISGDFDGAYTAGLIRNVAVRDENATTTFENVNVSGVLRGNSKPKATNGTVTGLLKDFQGPGITIRNIDIVATLEGDYVYGIVDTFFVEGWLNPEANETMIIEGININSTVNYFTEFTGLFSSAFIDYIGGDVVIRDINIITTTTHSHLGKGTATGLMLYFHYDGIGDVLITDIIIEGVLTGSTVYGFTQYLDPSYNGYSDGTAELNYELSNIQVNAEMKAHSRDNPNFGKPLNRYNPTGPVDTVEYFGGTVGGFFGYSTYQYSYSDNFTLKNIAVNGNMSVTGLKVDDSYHHSDIYGFAGIFKSTLGTEDALIVMENVTINGTMTIDPILTNGEIHPFVEKWELYDPTGTLVENLADDSFILRNNSVPSMENISLYDSSKINIQTYNK